jgi:hypothetical protein
MEECVVCWNEITDGSESSLALSKVARDLARKEMGYSEESSTVLICQHCIQDIIAEYFI